MTGSAHAYLDPGTGSMILRLLLGGIAAMAIVLKLYWYKVEALFGRRGAKEAALENDRPDATTRPVTTRPGGRRSTAARTGTDPARSFT